MDKKKILSSLAAAGILTASVLGANVNAATNLTSVGVYKQLVEGKTVVPYILEDGNTALTVKDVEAEFENLQLVNGIAVTDKNASLETGDTFKANNVEYTVIILGDANGNGTVKTSDALKVQDMSFDSGNDAILKVAADATADGKITTADALRIQDYLLGKEDISIPTPEEPEEDESIYTVTINDNGYINAQTKDNSIIKIKLSEPFEEAKRLSVVFEDEDGFEAAKGISIDAHSNYDETSVSTASFKKLKDGVIKGKVMDGDKVVGTFTTEKNTVVPNATKVITNRVSTKSATLSLEACGDSDITKVHYLVSSSEPSEDELVNELEVSGNSITDVTVSNELATKTSYKLYYVLENSYGSKSAMKSVVITSDSEDVTQAEKVEEITVPELAEVGTANFTWTGVQSVNYVATLYKDGNAVAVKTVKNDSGTDLTVDFTTEMSEVGTYYIDVYADATENTSASEVTESEEVTVDSLSAVTGLEFRNEDNKVILSWTNSNDKDSFKEYAIKLYTVDKDGKETESATISSPATDKNEVEVTSNINNNTVYVAKVTVVAKDGQLATVSSEETVSDQFYKVGTPSIDSAEISEHQITLNATGVTINGKTTTYKVKIFDVNESGNPEEPTLTLIDTRDVELKDGKIVIDGLDSNSPYSFKLIAVVDGEEVESDYSTPVYTLPELKNLTVVDKADDAEEGKIFAVDSDTIIVAGETIELSAYNNSAKLANSMKIINALKVGDVVTIEDQKVTLKLDGGASAQVEGRDFKNVTNLEETIFEIESNKYNKNINFGSQKVKEVILKGTDSMFTVTGTAVDKITLTDGVEITGEREYTIAADSTVIINGASVTTEEETVVTASTDTLTVKVNAENNNLVFENKVDSNLTINFEGEEDNTSVQSGSIVIKSNGGKVTVTSDKANVNAELTVEVNSGDVDITEASLTGDKNVTVSVEEGETSTIDTVAKTNAPIDLNGVSVDITDEDLRKVDDVTDDNFDDVKAFLQSFGLNGTGATITATKDSDEVTITFTATEDNTIENVEISNLK